ncbi:MAG: hypothetical protein Q9217_002106 [Psora testacea]
MQLQVPSRLNYILWVQDLLDTTSDDYTDEYDANREVIGLDMYADTILKLSRVGAEAMQRHGSQLYLSIARLRAKTEVEIRSANASSIDFTLCNPPFYASSADLIASAASKSRPPYSACTGADVEMVTPGGEVAFVSRMIDESKNLDERCQWYTSMLGKSNSVETVLQRLRNAGVDNWAVKDLVQGSKTKRWAVAWSWGSLRPTEVPMCPSKTNSRG